MSESTIEDVIHAALNYRRMIHDIGGQAYHRAGGKENVGDLTDIGHARERLFEAIDRLPQSVNKRSKGRIIK